MPLFAPQVKEHQIANLPSFNFYIKINGTVSQDVFTGTTHDFTVPRDEAVEQSVIKTSRLKYGADQETLKKLDEKLNIIELTTKIQKSKPKKKDNSDMTNLKENLYKSLTECYNCSFYVGKCHKF